MQPGINQVGTTPIGQQTTPTETQPTDNRGIVVQSGGQQIETQPNQQSLIQKAVADSAEEVTMAFQDKSANKLKLRDAKTRAASRLEELTRKYLKGVGDVKNAEKFEQLAESLKKMKKPTPQQIRDLIQEFSNGSEDGFEAGALLALEELFSADNENPELLEAIRGAKAEVGQELQSFYKDHIKNFDDVNDVYHQLLGDHSEGDFLTALETFITQLGEELQSEGSAADSSKVKSTVDSLYQLEVARNTFQAFAKLVEKFQTVFPSGSA